MQATSNLHQRYPNFQRLNIFYVQKQRQFFCLFVCNKLIIIWIFQVTEQITLNPGLAATGKKKPTYGIFIVTKCYIAPEIKWEKTPWHGIKLPRMFQDTLHIICIQLFINFFFFNFPGLTRNLKFAFGVRLHRRNTAQINYNVDNFVDVTEVDFIMSAVYIPSNTELWLYTTQSL